MSEYSVNGNAVLDPDGNQVAMIAVKGGELYLKREPRCSIGDYFAILTMLNDKGYKVK